MRIKNYLFLLPFVCFTAGYFISSLIVQQPPIIAPSLVGTSIAQACQIASHHDIAIKLLGEKEDNTVPPATVLRQTPGPGQAIKPYQSIYVLLSKQQEYTKAPDLIGMHIDKIPPVLSNTQIKTYPISSIHPREICFAQTPRPYEPITNNIIIVYVSADTKKPIIWPCFTGQLVQDVVALLDTHAIHADITHTRLQSHHHTCHDCRVVHQNPRPGSLLSLDSRKAITIQLQVE